MSSCVSKGFLRVSPVFYSQVRFRRKPNIQNPRPPPFEKAKLLAVCKHIEAEDTALPVEKCLKPVQSIPPYALDALDKIYASELQDLFKTSKLTAVFSKTINRYDDTHQAKILFFKANMKMVVRNKYIVKDAIGETEFRNLLPLFDAASFLVFSPDMDIAKLVQINKKLPHFHLLCAVVDQRILSVSQLNVLAAIPDIGTARAGIVQTLLSGAQSIAQSLQSQQNTLVQQLNQRVEQLQSSTNK